MKMKILVYISLMASVFWACDRRVITRTDTETSGVAVMAADECFSPIVKEELDVFTGLNEAEVMPIYTGEKEIFDLLVSDSVRLIMAARELTTGERAQIEAKKLTVRSQIIARDGIAIIVNRTNPDSIINFKTLRQIMTGEKTKWEEITGRKAGLGDIRVVFDNPNSSTLRFINEKILNGAAISNDIKALESNPSVLKYVTETPNAMGVIGVNWISNPYDSTKLTFDETIRVMAIGTTDEIDPDKACQPVPYYLYSGEYPLIREVYLILTDLRGTLSAGVVKFMGGDSGQRIIVNAGLVPATRPTRVVNLKNDF